MVKGCVVLDMMVMDLARRIKANPELSKKFEVMSLTFLDMVRKAFKVRDYPAAEYLKYLEELEQRLKTKKVLLFLGHLPIHEHYIGWTVNFPTEDISYGA